MSKIYSALYLGYMLQAFFFAFILYLSKRKETSNKILASFLFLSSVIALNMFLLRNGVHETFPHMLWLTESFVLLTGPLIYLYIKVKTTGKNDILKADMIHFFPYFLSYFFNLFFFHINSGAEKLQIIESFINGEYLILLILDIVKISHKLLYLAAAWNLLVRFRNKRKSSMEQHEKRKLAWMGLLLSTISMASIITITGVVGLLFFKDGLFKTLFTAPALFNIALIYIIFYIGLKFPEVFSISQNSNEMMSDSEAKKESKDREIQKYRTLNIEPELTELYVKSILNYMEKEKPYLSSVYSMKHLSHALEIPYHHLSMTINSHLNQNFYTFMHGYRVEEAKNILIDKKSRNKNLTEVAYEAGFKSKSTFNTVFKKMEGTTPSEYRSRAKNETDETLREAQQ